MLILKQFHHYQEWLLLTAKRVALGTERSESNKSAYWLSKALFSDCIWVYLMMLTIQFSHPGSYKPWADGWYNIHAQASIYFIPNAC